MPVLIAVVAVVGIMCALNLLLLLGVLRRLREHSDRLRNTAMFEPPGVGIEAGERPAEFSAVTKSGTEVSNASELLVAAFFTTSCPACTERVAPFAEYLTSHGIAPERALAVIVQDSNEDAPFLRQLEDVAMVCVEPVGGPIGSAFKLKAFPGFWLLDADGVVAASAFDPGVLPAPARV